MALAVSIEYSCGRLNASIRNTDELSSMLSHNNYQVVEENLPRLSCLSVQRLSSHLQRTHWHALQLSPVSHRHSAPRGSVATTVAKLDEVVLRQRWIGTVRQPIRRPLIQTRSDCQYRLRLYPEPDLSLAGALPRTLEVSARPCQTTRTPSLDLLCV